MALHGEEAHFKMITVILAIIGIVVGGMQAYQTSMIATLEKHVFEKNQDQDARVDQIQIELVRRQVYIDRLNEVAGNIQSLTEIVERNTADIDRIKRHLDIP